MNLDPRLLQLARRHRLALGLTVLFGLAGGVLTVLQAGLISRTVDQVFLKGAGLPDVARLLAALLGAIVLRAAAAWASERAGNAVAAGVKDRLRRRLAAHLFALGPGYASGERTGELVNTLQEGVEALEAYFSQYLPQLVLAALLPLTYLAFVFPLDPLSGLVLLLTAPLIPLFMILIGSLAQAMTRRRWQVLSRTSAYFLDVLQGLTTLKMLGRSRAQANVIEQVSKRFGDATMNVLRVTFLSALVLEMVATISTAVVAVQVGLRLLYGRLAFEQALFVLLLAPEFYLPLRTLGVRFHAGMSGVTAARRIFEILETAPPSAAAGPAGGSEPAPPAPPTAPRIELRGVGYRYPDKRTALEEVSLELPAGSRTALVGPSGAGKSTLAALLLRFAEPQRGAILVDGQPLEHLSSEAWRLRVAWVPQRPYLFNTTVLENIRLARPEAGREAVERAARRAGADEFIRRLPHGYETEVGERAARLSGGQAQRIVLARAFLKDAPLLILDEATANLDPELEAEIGAALERLMAGRTTLIIAHRLNTVRTADRIVVLEAGRVVQAGRHDDLLRGGGLYARLVNAAEAAEPPAGAPARRRPDFEGPFSAGDLGPGSLPPVIPGDPVEPARSPHSDLAVMRRLLGLVRPFAGRILLAALAGFAAVGSNLGLLGASAFIISAAALQPSIAALQVAIVGVRAFGIARGLFRYLERYGSHQVTFRLLARLRVWFYSALEPLAPACLADYRSGDLLSRVMGDIETLENFYVRALGPPLVAGMVAAAAGLYLYGFAPRLALALLAFLALAGLGMPLLMRRLGREPGRRVVAARSALDAALVDAVQGLADLLAFGRSAQHSTEIAAASARLAAARRRLADLVALQNALATLLANLGLWVVLALAIPLVSAGAFSGVYLAVVALVALASFEAVLPLPLAAQHLESHLQSARRLFALVEAQPAAAEPAEPAPFPARDGAQPPDLEVRNLSFRYPLPEAPDGTVLQPAESSALHALHDLTFRLPAGGRMAVVGPSGAGKSTLVHLLLRFWDYETGEIRLNGVDLRRLSSEEVRRRVAVVPQNPYLFNASVRENLLIANPKASDRQLAEAVQTAGLGAFIESLPEGYDTWIGEQGLRLSGGERQRLAIARALLQDAPLLLLDEPTANLDTLTERRVLEAMEPLMAGRSVLLITHRLAGLEKMDCILVLRSGRLVESGAHAELLQAGGLYRRMYALQNNVLAD